MSQSLLSSNLSAISSLTHEFSQATQQHGTQYHHRSSQELWRRSMSISYNNLQCLATHRYRFKYGQCLPWWLGAGLWLYDFPLILAVNTGLSGPRDTICRFSCKEQDENGRVFKAPIVFLIEVIHVLCCTIPNQFSAILFHSCNEMFINTCKIVW